MKILVKKFDKNAIVPTKSHITDAGYDLYAMEDAVIYPEDTLLVRTGIGFAIPTGYAGLIWDRSGLGSKGLHRHGGVIDSEYRGEVKVALSNTLSHEKMMDNVFLINKGDRIAQILFQKVPHFDLVEVEDLDDTDRGKSGFGSTGN
jgi:dUTP pyrophosphatase